MRDPNIIDNAIKLFLENPNFDSLRSVQISKENPFKMWTIENKSLKQIALLENIKEPYNEPRQKLPLSYWQNGYIDIVKSSVLKNQESTTGEKILPYIIDNPSIDLDYPEEIEKAENQLNEKINKNKKVKILHAEILDGHFHRKKSACSKLLSSNRACQFRGCHFH